jgi:succinate-semialdehyde dehydrogenase/glutarate-semialdehyde dehydrogenase
VSASRVLVQDRVHDELCERLAAATAGLRVAPGRQPGAQIGPLIDAAALAKVEAHVEDAVARGAHVLTGGARHPLGGTFYQPTVLAGILPAMRFSCEETFGPVVGISRFSREADALRLANDTPTGLAMYAYTRDVGRLWRTIDRAEYGVIGMNTGLVSNATAPFGGMKESGLGREGGHQGLDEWLETKYVCLGGVDET